LERCGAIIYQGAFANIERQAHVLRAKAPAGCQDGFLSSKYRAAKSRALTSEPLKVRNDLIAKRTGDGSIVEFRSVVDAVCWEYGRLFRSRTRIALNPYGVAMQQIAEWLEKLGLSEYAQHFIENRIDFEILPDFSGWRPHGEPKVGSRSPFESPRAP
jgi:SAM domain (Sterile alpha motif)